jgi:small-conductance mechanosensitive channel
MLWEPAQVVGLESVGSDFVVIQTQAKTMPGRATAVARELRWRIKRAFDEAGIVISGGTPTVAVQEAVVPEGAPAAAEQAATPAAEPVPVPPPATGER